MLGGFWPRLIVAGAAALGGCGGPGPGQEGSAIGDYGAAIVTVSGGALEIALSDATDACASRADWSAFLTQPGLRIRLLAVEVRRPSLYEGPFVTAVQYPVDGRALPPLDVFTATHLDGSTPAQLASNASAGELQLSAAPDYDTGAVSGSYDLTVEGRTYSGTFSTAYCPTTTAQDLEALGFEMVRSCGVEPPMPLQPGRIDVPRDARRGLAALGLSDEEASCLAQVVELYCGDDVELPPAWSNAEPTLCIADEVLACLELARLNAEACGG